MDEAIEHLPGLVDRHARMRVEVARLARQRIKVTDEKGQIVLRVSGDLRVEELTIAPEAAADVEVLSATLAVLIEQALERATTLARTRLGIAGGDLAEIGLPEDRPALPGNKKRASSSPDEA